MSLRIVLPLCCAVMLLHAAEAQQFLAPHAAIDAAKIIPPPPPDFTPAGRADLETVLHVQADRTPEQLSRARRVDSQSPFSFGQAVLGDWFKRENLPRAAAIFDAVERQCEPCIAGAKDIWKRPRPYERDPAVRPSVKLPHSPSYPSGHTAHAAVWAAVLSAAFPERAKEFSEQVREVMWCRVIGGVHYPTDTTAGQTLGEALGDMMVKSADMEKAVAVIREEAAPFLKKN